MNVGYARVSTRDQTVALQVDALKAVGCGKVYTEVISGAATERPILAKLLDEVRPGDIVVVWKLDRLGRSLKHLVETVNLLLQQDVGIKSLNDPIDTTTPQGRLVFNLFASLAEFERDVIRERTQAGLSAARGRGRTGVAQKGCRSKPNPPLAPPKRCTVKAYSAHNKLPSTCIFPRALYTPISAIAAYPLAYRGRFDRAGTCPVPRKIIPAEILIDLTRRLAMLPAQSRTPFAHSGNSACIWRFRADLVPGAGRAMPAQGSAPR